MNPRTDAPRTTLRPLSRFVRKWALFLGGCLAAVPQVPAQIPVNDNTSPPYTAVFNQGLTYQSGFRNDNNFGVWLNRGAVWATAFNGGTGNSWTWTDIAGNQAICDGGKRWVDSHPGAQFILSCAMLPGTGGLPAYDTLTPATSDRVSLARGARGDYDAYFTALAQKIVAAGVADKTIIRLGWEFNGGWYPWRVKAITDLDNPESHPAHFAAYFARIVNVMEAVPGIPASGGQPAKAGGSALRFCWNGAIVWTPWAVSTAFPKDVPAGTTTTGVSYPAYGGNAFVDYVGLDVYDVSYSVYEKDKTPPYTQQQLEDAWEDDIYGPNNNNNGIARWQYVAGFFGKPITFPEWGLSDRTGAPDPADDANNPDGGKDNPFFIQKMHEHIQNPANNVYFHSYWDVNTNGADGRISQLPGGPASVHPNAAREFKKLFGLPLPNRNEIGSVSAASTANGISVSGGGIGFASGTTDEFYFASRDCATNDSFTAKITSASVAAGQAGLMVRQGTTTAGAVYGALAYSNGTLTFRSRATAPTEGSVQATVSGVSLPVWLKLVRQGNSVHGYRSSNGLNWSYVGGRSVSFSSSAQIGVAVSSGASGTLNVVEVDKLDNASLVMGQETSIANKIVQDNSSSGVSYSGSWGTGTTRTDKYGADYRHMIPEAGIGSVTFTPGITSATAGLYDVFVHWPQDGAFAYDVPITVNRVNGNDELSANQEAGYNEWVHAGTFNLAAGNNVVIRNSTNLATSHTVADAVMFVPLPAAPVAVINPSFESDAAGSQTITGWIESGANTVASFVSASSPARTGTRYLGHYVNGSGYTVFTSQNLGGLANGLYTLRAWVQRSGTWSPGPQMEASGFGGSTVSAVIPVVSTWTQITIANINVTNGTCTIGFRSNGAAASSSIKVDDVEFFRQ